MRRTLFALALLASSFVLSLTAHADGIDDFVLTSTDGSGITITFSLPASPPGNLTTCPPVFPSSCLPGSETDFSVITMVTNNGVSTKEGIDFPTSMFEGGMSLGATRFFGPQLFEPNAATPTFLIGTFDLDTFGDPPFFDYSLTITPEPATTPEPSSVALLATGMFGLVGFAVFKRRAFQQ
jgi:hypothetical protein